MSASANERFGVAPAPEGLVLVQELLNTLAVNDAADLLQDLATAQPWAEDVASQWAERKGQLPPDTALTVRDLSRLRSLRGRLRASLSAGTDDEVNSRATTAATVQLSLGSAVTAVPCGPGFGLVHLSRPARMLPSSGKRRMAPPEDLRQGVLPRRVLRPHQEQQRCLARLPLLRQRDQPPRVAGPAQARVRLLRRAPLTPVAGWGQVPVVAGTS